jgi:hypothetical protein
MARALPFLRTSSPTKHLETTHDDNERRNERKEAVDALASTVFTPFVIQ